ncbi:MAG: CoA transferase, partial [Chloroflexi bacterium]|nr:CoA transferase [Chloroflexota bacterium]
MSEQFLQGLRVLDFSWAVAGPHSTLLLADLGAQVIRIGTEGRSAFATVPEIDTTNLGKYSVSLNLRTPAGLTVARRLVGMSDVVVENFRPGVMNRLGLGYEDNRRIKPDIIMIAGSGFGSTGPHAGYAAFAPMFAALSSLASLTGYPDGIPTEIRMTPDFTGGTFMAIAVIAALQQRLRTGEGQFIDLSFREALTGMFGEILMDADVNHRDAPRMGNHDRIMAPHGVFRCLGEDSWIAIAVKTEEEWQALVHAMGDPEWARSEAFNRREARLANQDELERLINQWTVNFTPENLTSILQAQGVAATPSYTPRQLCEDPHLKERGFFFQVPTAHRPWNGFGGPWVINGERPFPPARIPRLGDDSDLVLREVLGLAG